MNKARIFLVGDTKDRLIPMEESAYVQEADLQNLLSRYPDLLPGDQITPENPRRWLLVAQEMGVPGDTDEAGRWSLDHLFLDQDGIPTFVECKRSSDTRIRREVVAQMLDYAANGTEYWGPDRLRQSATETAQAMGRELDDLIVELLQGNEDVDIEDYWETVEANLRAGRVRLLFVADQTPKELRRLVEFLNEKMTDVEVLAVEVKQFLGKDGHQVVVSRAIGVTEATQARKSSTRSRSKTTRAEFLEAVGQDAAHFYAKMVDRAEESGFIVSWGTKGYSVRAKLRQSGATVSFAYGWPWNGFDVYLNLGDYVPQKKLDEIRSELLTYDVFREAGQHTLSAKITEENFPEVTAAYGTVLQRMLELKESY